MCLPHTQEVSGENRCVEDPEAASVQEANAAYQRCVLAVHEAHAERLEVVLEDPPKWGWYDRTLGQRGVRDGVRVWVRTVTEQIHWVDEDFWSGNVAANAITGVPKPSVVEWTETRDSDRWFRSEALTFVEAPVASPSADLSPAAVPHIDAAWMTELRDALDALSGTRTDRVARTQEEVRQWLREYFGDRIDPNVDQWVTAHGDLHWANLTAPDLTMLDWEGWGVAPYGYDVATLYCYTLLAPSTAELLREVFADVLDSPDGVRSQLLAVARILRRTRGGEFDHLVLALHRHADALLDR